MIFNTPVAEFDRLKVHVDPCLRCAEANPETYT